MKNKLLVFSVGVLSLAVLFSAGAVFGQGRNNTWTPPAQQFPAGNTTPPVDVGAEKQTKVGEFTARVLESSNSLGGPGFILQPNTSIQSGQNTFFLSTGGYSVLNSLGHIFLNSNSGSIQINAPAGTANFSITKGLVLPNYTTTQLGTGVPAGTVTYNPTTGELWLFTGGTNCNEQQGGILNSASAQSGRCWVKVATGSLNVNTYWQPVGTGKIHYDNNVGINTGTAEPRGPLDIVSGADNKPAYFSSAKGLVLPNYTTAQLGSGVPAGTITWDNTTGKLYVLKTQTGGSKAPGLVGEANAQVGGTWVEIGAGGQPTNVFWQAGTGGAIHYPGGNVGIGTNAPAINLAIGDTDTGLKWISDGNLAVYTNNAERMRVDSSGSVGIGTSMPTAKLDVVGSAKLTGDVTLAPSGQSAYTVKNSAGTIGLYNGSNAVNFSVGQDGVVLVKDRIAAQGTTLQIVGSSGSESVLKVGGTYGGTFRPGRVEIAHPNGTDTISLKQEYGKTLSISEPGNNKTLKINLDNVLATSCFNVNGVDPHRFLKVDANGWLVCADLPNSSPTVQIFPAPGSNPLAGDNMIDLGNNWSLCSLSWMESTGGPGGDPFRPTGCEVGKNTGNNQWYLRAIKNGEWNARCKATCVRF